MNKTLLAAALVIAGTSLFAGDVLRFRGENSQGTESSQGGESTESSASSGTQSGTSSGSESSGEGISSGTEDILDLDVPLGPGSPEDDGKILGLPKGAVIGGAAGIGALGILGIILAFVKKKKKGKQ